MANVSRPVSLYNAASYAEAGLKQQTKPAPEVKKPTAPAKKKSPAPKAKPKKAAPVKKTKPASQRKVLPWM